MQNVAQIISLFVFKNYIIYLILQVAFVFFSNAVVSKVASKRYPYIDMKNPPRLSKKEIWDLIKNIKALTVTKISGIIVNNTDNIVITYFNGLITTGVISNYTLIVNALNSLVNQVFAGLTGSVGNLNAVESEEHKYNIFKSLNLLNFWIYAIVAIFIVVVSSDFIDLFFGSSYVTGIEIPIILAINFYMNGMQCVVGLYKSTMGLFKYGQYILLITAFFNLIGDLYLGSKYGVFGILLATAIARLLTNTFYEPYVIFKHGFKIKFLEYIKRYLTYVFLMVISCVSCLLVVHNFNFIPLFNVIFKTLICIIIPNIIFVLWFCKNNEFIYILNSIKNILIKVLRKE